MQRVSAAPSRCRRDWAGSGCLAMLPPLQPLGLRLAAVAAVLDFVPAVLPFSPLHNNLLGTHACRSAAGTAEVRQKSHHPPAGRLGSSSNASTLPCQALSGGHMKQGCLRQKLGRAASHRTSPSAPVRHRQTRGRLWPFLVPLTNQSVSQPFEFAAQPKNGRTQKFRCQGAPCHNETRTGGADMFGVER